MPDPPESSGPPEDPLPGDPLDEPAHRRASPPPGSAEEALRRLEQRLDRASEAAERLMAQAAAAAAGNPPASAGDPFPGGEAGEPVKPPPSGWQIPEDAAAPPELDPLVALVQAMRELVPPDLQRRLVAALRELLLAVRALIDW